MSTAKRVLGGCVLVPVLLVASCAAKMYVDERMYDLPGPILKSSAKVTQSLDSAEQVAEALDSYVQPRFEILRDKNFGAFRITYRKHAGIVQLKVDSEREKRLIANINAAGRDYAISLLDCAAVPGWGTYYLSKPRLRLLYFNQTQLVSDAGYMDSSPRQVEAENDLNLDTLQKQGISALQALRAGREYRAADATWTVLMRPVLASKQECIGCHTGTKRGDTLGVMAYAVRNARRSDLHRIGLFRP